MLCRPHSQRAGGNSEPKTGLGGHRKKDVHVSGPSWDWQEYPSPAQLPRNISVQKTFGKYVSDSLYMQPSHSLPRRGKEGREGAHRRWERSPLPAWQLLPGLTSEPEGSGREASSSMQKIMVATGGAAQGQTSPSKAAAAIYISERQSKERG